MINTSAVVQDWRVGREKFPNVRFRVRIKSVDQNMLSDIDYTE